MSRAATIVASCAVALVAASGPPATPAAAENDCGQPPPCWRYETRITYEQRIERRGVLECSVTYRITTVLRFPVHGVDPEGQVVSTRREQISVTDCTSMALWDPERWSSLDRFDWPMPQLVGEIET